MRARKTNAKRGEKQGGFKSQVQKNICNGSTEMEEGPWKRWKTKSCFPLSHGTATAIYMNGKRFFVAPGF
jgi:hypothetical protein